MSGDIYNAVRDNDVVTLNMLLKSLSRKAINKGIRLDKDEVRYIDISTTMTLYLTFTNFH